MISIFKKELRDCLKWVPAGMLIALVMVWQSLPSRIDRLYGTESALMGAIGYSAVLIAFAFGLLQSLFDIRNDARGYLLHRPVRRSDIFWAKVASGFVAYVLALTPAVLLALYYLNSRGLEFLPVSGWQVIPGLLAALAAFLVHPVAMWVGNRDARWVGTRVLPLAGIVAVLFFITVIYQTGYGGSPTDRLLVFAASWVVHIVAAIVVFVAARHAFCNRQMLPPASGKHAASWARIFGLTFSGIAVATASVVFILSSLNPVELNYTTRQLLMKADGDFQQVQVERKSWDWNERQYSVRPAAESETDFSPVDEQWKLAEYSVVRSASRYRYSWFDQFRNMGEYATGKSSKGPLRLFAHRGRLLAYGGKQLTAIVTPQGVARGATKPQGKFQDVGIFQFVQQAVDANGQLGRDPLVVDATGLFQFDSTTFEMHRLLSKGVERACMLYADDKYPATLWTVGHGTLTRHEISPVEDGVELTEKKLKNDHHTVSLPLLKIDSSKEYKIDLPEDPYSISVFRGDDGRYSYVKYNIANQEHFYGMLGEDGRIEKLGPVNIPATSSANEDDLGLGVPPVVAFGMCIWGVLFGAASPFGILGYAIPQALLAAVGTFLLCKWLDLSNRHCWIWTVVALFSGLGIGIAVVACHQRLVKETCPHCHKQTRVDLETCTLCGQPWLPPELDQIEIFDGVGKAA